MSARRRAMVEAKRGPGFDTGARRARDRGRASAGHNRAGTHVRHSSSSSTLFSEGEALLTICLAAVVLYVACPLTRRRPGWARRETGDVGGRVVVLYVACTPGTGVLRRRGRRYKCACLVSTGQARHRSSASPWASTVSCGHEGERSRWHASTASEVAGPALPPACHARPVGVDVWGTRVGSSIASCRQPAHCARTCRRAAPTRFRRRPAPTCSH